jgi:hypothetical protein
MADEVYYSGLTSSARVSAVLSQMIAVKLYDVATLVNHPSIMRVNPAPGSTTVQIPVISWGANGMAAVAENASVANTALTTSSVTCVLARQALRRQISDLAQVTAQGVPLDVTLQGLADDMSSAWSKRGTTMITALASGFSNSVGSTGVDLSVTAFYNAIFSLQLTANSGQFVAILHNQQINDLMSSLRSETGPGQYLAATQEMLNAKGPGFKGQLFGVDIFGSNTVATANAGADYLGMMIAPNAIAMATASVSPIVGATTQPGVSPVTVEFERDASGGSTVIVGSLLAGVCEVDDAKGVGILSDF